MEDIPMKRVFDLLKNMDVDFPASAGDATYDSPVIFRWTGDTEPYSYIEKMHQLIEFWCAANHKAYICMSGNHFSKPMPDRKLIDRMSVQVKDLDCENASIENIDFVFDITEPFRVKHSDIAEPDYSEAAHDDLSLISLPQKENEVTLNYLETEFDLHRNRGNRLLICRFALHAIGMNTRQLFKPIPPERIARAYEFALQFGQKLQYSSLKASQNNPPGTGHDGNNLEPLIAFTNAIAMLQDTLDWIEFDPPTLCKCEAFGEWPIIKPSIQIEPTYVESCESSGINIFVDFTPFIKFDYSNAIALTSLREVEQAISDWIIRIAELIQSEAEVFNNNLIGMFNMVEFDMNSVCFSKGNDLSQKALRLIFHNECDTFTKDEWALILKEFHSLCAYRYAITKEEIYDYFGSIKGKQILSELLIEGIVAPENQKGEIIIYEYDFYGPDRVLSDVAIAKEIVRLRKIIKK